MIWILAQCSQKMVCATAVWLEGRDEAVKAPVCYELWAQVGDRECRVGAYQRYSDALNAFDAVRTAIENGANIVDVRTV